MSMILFKFLTMTFVTDANFWKSNVLSGVTYMFRARDARLHTATCKQKSRFTERGEIKTLS